MKTNKLILTVSILVATITIIGLVFALPINNGINIAKEKSPAIDDEGNVLPPQPEEDELTKIVFIRYAPKFARNKPCNNDNVCDANEGGWCGDCKGKEEPGTTSSCYGFLAGSKPRWKWVEDYYYNDAELGASSLLAVTKWNNATSGTIFGTGNFSNSAPWGSYDYQNSITYGNYPEPGVIGVTAIWYQGKTIYEYDIMYDTDYFPNNGSIDLDTVVLHELGHGAGLGDLYDTICTEEVMYGYYQGIKSDLRGGDIVGIQKLYG